MSGNTPHSSLGRHQLIQATQLPVSLDNTDAILIVSSRESSPTCSPNPSYIPLQEKLPLPLSLPNVDMGHRPAQSIYNLLNALSVGSPPSPVNSPSPPITRNPTPSNSLPIAPMSAPISTAQRPAYFAPRNQRPSVDIPSSSHAQRPDLYRRHSSHPYEYNPATNRIIYREFDFSPVGSRAPISRTTKACNACRTRKVRCDAGGDSESGICSRCREAGVECVYAGLQKKRGPCPGAARPGQGMRRQQNQNQTISEVSPPELSPTSHDTQSSYGFPSSEPDQPYFPPITPTPTYHSNPFFALPPMSTDQMPNSGWTSSQPRPLPNSTPNSRRPTSSSSNSGHSRKPSFVSWHPADIPEERSRMFEQDYSIQAIAEEGDRRVRLEEENVRMRPRYSQAPVESAFGDHGRSLPPLRVVLGDAWNRYDPRRDI